MTLSSYSVDTPVLGIDRGRILHVAPLSAYGARWFEGGRLIILDGDGKNLRGSIKTDRISGDTRFIELWQSFNIIPRMGDSVRLEAGCDKIGKTCRNKFSNFLNFRGFPNIPGEDWLLAGPRAGLGG